MGRSKYGGKRVNTPTTKGHNGISNGRSNARLWPDRAEFVTTKSVTPVSTGQTRIIVYFSESAAVVYHTPGAATGAYRIRPVFAVHLWLRKNKNIVVLRSVVSPRASRNSWGSSRWWSDWGTSTASAACTSPGPVRSCRPGRRSAPRRWPFARTCAWTASPTAPACRLSAHRWWSPAGTQTGRNATVRSNGRNELLVVACFPRQKGEFSSRSKTSPERAQFPYAFAVAPKLFEEETAKRRRGGGVGGPEVE